MGVSNLVFSSDINPQLNPNLLCFYSGAAYHRSKETMAMLERLNVPITMTAPYSYDVAPAELFYAAFK